MSTRWRASGPSSVRSPTQGPLVAQARTISGEPLHRDATLIVQSDTAAVATLIPTCTLRAMNLLAGIQIGATRMSVRQIQLRSQRSVRAQFVTDA